MRREGHVRRRDGAGSARHDAVQRRRPGLVLELPGGAGDPDDVPDRDLVVVAVEHEMASEVASSPSRSDPGRRSHVPGDSRGTLKVAHDDALLWSPCP